MSTPQALKVRVGGRLALGFALLVALTTALGLYSIRGVDRMHAAGDQVATNWLPAMQALAEYRVALDMMRRAEANYVLLTDSTRAALELPRITAARSQADAAWRAYRQTITDDEERRAATRVEEADSRYRELQEHLLRMPLGSRAASEALRETLLGASRESARDVYAVLGDVVAYQQRGAKLSHAAAARDYEETRYVVTGVVSVTVTLAAVVALLIAISIGRDVRSLREGYESALHGESLRASELERANEQLIQTNMQLVGETRRREAAEDQLERLNRRKDEFIATIAHELRGPLSALMNAAAVLRASGATEPMRRHATQVVDRQSRQMARLVDDLTDAARLVTGNLSLHLDGLDVRKVIEAAVELTAATVAERRQLLNIELEPEGRCQVVGDHGRLVQVLTNLLGNAARYTPEGGRIDIELVREEADAVVRVRDTGVGIAPEMLDRIFDMFEQGGKPPGSGAGLGLGLALARQLAKLHGGHLAVTSPGLGRGACFTLRLPLHAEMPCKLSAHSDFLIAAPSTAR
jgi:signal transduction histidine kinase